MTESTQVPQADPALLAQATAGQHSVTPISVSPPAETEVAKAAVAGGLGATEVDVAALLAGIQALQERVQALEKEKASGAALPVIATAETLRDLIKTHVAHNPGSDHAALLGLADDAVDAAGNAVTSGDGAILTGLAGKIEKALNRIHPGPGDHHYFRQALDFAAVHLPDAAGNLVKQPAVLAPSLTSDRPPAKVIEGNITG